MPPLQPKSWDDLISSTLESLYSIQGFSDSEKIEDIRLALVKLLESQRPKRLVERAKPSPAKIDLLRGLSHYSLNE
ncbi:hypothetical protein RLEG3_14600 [Rhizobium leguminosarum bv. trifolii WSM1689]|nr:hypothetical protein RLEG3_14600 [Rhizobium leguminosarum bv. trifolii WSM1689]